MANITSIGVVDSDESVGGITALSAMASRFWLDGRGGVKCTDAWTRLRCLAVRSRTCRVWAGRWAVVAAGVGCTGGEGAGGGAGAGDGGGGGTTGCGCGCGGGGAGGGADRCALVVGGGSGLGMVVVTSAARDPLTKTWVNANPSNASAKASTNRNPAATRTIDPFRIGYPHAPQDVPGDSSTDFWFVHLNCRPARSSTDLSRTNRLDSITGLGAFAEFALSL
jgi:hypothetical protein